MLPTPMPRAFDLLVGRLNTAADAALAECLPHFAGATQEAALRILIDRGHTPTLASLIQGFRDADENLKTAIVRNAVGLATGIRSAITSSSAADRAVAIEVISRADAPQLAHMLADSLRGGCPRTRMLAGQALRSLTASFLARLQCHETDPLSVPGRSAADDLSDALQRAVLSWDAHMSVEALEAALWYAERLEPTLRRKLEDTRSTLLAAVKKEIQAPSDVRVIGFFMVALGIPLLRDTAASSIAQLENPEHKRELIRHASLLEDAEVMRGWRSIRDWQWLFGAAELLARLTGSEAANGVRMITAAGGPHDRKIELYRELLNNGHDDVRRAVLAALAADRSEAARILMRLVAGRSDDSIAPHATELLHDHPKPRATRTAGGAASQRPRTATHQPLTLQDLQVGLAHSEPLVRARSLQRLRKVGGVPQLATEVYRLSHDPEPVVRSLAVALLPEVPGPTTERILRAAINDPDERVQANAIEAMDRLDLPERVVVTAPKLNAASSRVRANAVKSLLRTELRESAETLLDMLEADSRAQRLSALWVIERMGLSALLGRLHELETDDPDDQVRARAHEVIRTLLGHEVISSWWHDAARTEEADGGEETDA